MLKLFTAAALAATLAASANAQGAPAAAGDTFTVAVRSGDLNLGTASGLAAFRGRVRHVADEACGEAKVRPLLDATLIAQCRAGVIRSAEARASYAQGQQDTRVAGTR